MIFLFSSFTGLPDRYFSGYAFSGSDFISGDGGAIAFRKATGLEVTGGLDGCYLSVWREGDKHRIGVDYSGYKKIFYYMRDGVWAISNSVTRLAEHLRANDVRLSPDFVQLRSLQIDNTVTAQLSSFRTVVSGISLLPSKYEIEVSGGGVAFVRRTTNPAADYRASLKEFLELWIARLETLLADSRVQLTCDLTGGNDSRLVFGLLMKARARMGIVGEDPFYIRSGTGSRWKKDFEAASTIARHYKATLNNPIPEALGLRQHGEFLSYQNWKDLCLCAYFPVYFAPRKCSSFALHLHGGGGENHRDFYPYGTFDGFAESILTPPLTGDVLLEYWIGSVGASIRELRQESPGVGDWILHYREFRSRLHGGRSPQYRNVLSPLASREMEQLSNFPAKSEKAQAHFDAMSSLFPELIHFPYDNPKKAPAPSVLDKLTTVEIDSHPSPGSAYIDPEESIPGGSANCAGATALDMLLADFSDANTPEVRELMPGVVQRALRAVEGVAGQKAFGHASDAKSISRVMSAAFALTQV